jgi:cell wall-associated NlpC family hydrolase
MMRKSILTLVSLFLLLTCQGQTKRAAVEYVTTPEDRALAETVLVELKAHPSETPGEQMVRAAEALLGQPYVAGTLEELPEEKLCIYLTRTDCILFVETCLGLVRTARQDGDFEMFADELLQSRYRDGRCARYEDRIHYTTEWARGGVARGALQDMSAVLGGVTLDHPVHYMSTHPDAYARMTDVDAIREMEDRINAETSTYIPKSKLKAALGGIRSGDILCFDTRTEGLDISHCAIALVEPGKPVRFIHASTGAMKVVVEAKTLEEYVMGRKAITGVQVFRVR